MQPYFVDLTTALRIRALVQDTKEQKQQRQTESGNCRSKQLTHDAYRV